MLLRLLTLLFASVLNDFPLQAVVASLHPPVGGSGETAFGVCCLDETEVLSYIGQVHGMAVDASR